MNRQIMVSGLALLAVMACNSDPGTGPSIPAEPTGELLIYDPTGTVHVVDVITGEAREISRYGEPVIWVSAAFGKNGTVVVGGGTGVGQPTPGVRQLDLETGGITTLVDGVLGYAARLAPDDKTLAFGALDWVPGRPALVLMDLTTREASLLWAGEEPYHGISDLRWLPDQSGLIGFLIQISSVQIIHFDISTRTITPITEPQSTSRLIATFDLSPDGQTIAYSTSAGELKFINQNGTPAAGFPTDLHGLLPAFSSDGKLLAWSRYREDSYVVDGVWFYRFSDGAMWRAMPEDSPLTWVLDWE